MTASEKEKKRKERVLLDEARRASSIFPSGECVPYEKPSFPDFLLHTDGGATIGIEVTELCQEEERAEGGRLAKVAAKAEGLYGRLPGNDPVEVSAAFAPEIKNVSFGRLVRGLADFVYAHRETKGCFNWNDINLPEGCMPEGYCYIGIHPARDGIGWWHTGNAFDTAIAPREMLESRIARKNLRLPEYRFTAREIWLLIVNNQFLGAGEVKVRLDDLTKWKFAFDFEKVLLFFRGPAGIGEVIELQRESACQF